MRKAEEIEDINLDCPNKEVSARLEAWQKLALNQGVSRANISSVISENLIAEAPENNLQSLIKTAVELEGAHPAKGLLYGLAITQALRNGFDGKRSSNDLFLAYLNNHTYREQLFLQIRLKNPRISKSALNYIKWISLDGLNSLVQNQAVVCNFPEAENQILGISELDQFFGWVLSTFKGPLGSEAKHPPAYPASETN